MSIFIIKNNKNIIGIYNDLEIALDYVYSLHNSNFISNNVIIEKYKINSYILLEELEVDLNYKITIKNTIKYNKVEESKISINLMDDFEIESNMSTTNDNITVGLDNITIGPDNTTIGLDATIIEKDDDSDTYFKNKSAIEKYNVLGQERIDIIHDINLLKEQQKKETEKENIYNSDIKLYDIFKLKKENNPKFEIPELFTQKYEIFKNLELNNSLNYENFYKIYEPQQIKTSFDDCFNDIEIKCYIQIDEIENNVDFKDVEIGDLIDIN
jgi:hypothetical protein